MRFINDISNTDYSFNMVPFRDCLIVLMSSSKGIKPYSATENTASLKLSSFNTLVQWKSLYPPQLIAICVDFFYDKNHPFIQSMSFNNFLVASTFVVSKKTMHQETITISTLKK